MLSTSSERPDAFSEAEQAEGAANLARDFRDYESFRRSWRPEKPPPPARTITVPTADGGKPIDVVAFLNETLAELDYAPIGRSAFESLNVFGFRGGSCANDIEHFLEFVSSGKPPQYLAASVQVRHPQADAFANDFMLPLLPEAYREIFANKLEWQCVLSFSLGDGWGKPLNRKLDIAELTSAELKQSLEDPIKKLEPITDIADLLELALRLEGGFPNIPWADPARAAMTCG